MRVDGVLCVRAFVCSFCFVVCVSLLLLRFWVVVWVWVVVVGVAFDLVCCFWVVLWVVSWVLLGVLLGVLLTTTRNLSN